MNTTDNYFKDLQGSKLEPADQNESGGALTGFVCGIVACVLNALFFTSFFGLPVGMIGLVFGLANMRYAKGRAGVALSLASFVILLVWLASIIFPIVLDPTFRWDPSFVTP